MKWAKPWAALVAGLLLCSLCITAQQPQERKALFAVEKDGKWGFIDRTGRIVIPIAFDGVNDFHEGLALVILGGKKEFIDDKGQVVFAPQFDVVYDFSEGVAAVNKGQVRNGIGLIANPGKWGYIDKTGKLVIPMKFTHAESFSEGLAAVNNGDSDHGAFIDHSGKTVFETPLDVTLGFHEGIAGVLLRGSVAYFDRRGRKISPPIDYGPRSNSFSEGLVPISTKDKWGFMDATGRLVIPGQFEDAGDFSEGLAPVKVRGETVWCPRDAEGNRSGATMMWGYIDKTGKLVIPPIFNSADPFSEGVASVKKCDEAFFIDRFGQKAISGSFTYAYSFNGGLARFDRLTAGGLVVGYVDHKGKVVWGPAN